MESFRKSVSIKLLDTYLRTFSLSYTFLLIIFIPIQGGLSQTRRFNLKLAQERVYGLAITFFQLILQPKLLIFLFSIL